MKDLAMIACVSKDGGLGYQGDLLWRFKEDQKFFRETTMGHPIIMGGKTFTSIGRPLSGRDNIILSHSMQDCDGVQVFANKSELEQYLQNTPGQKFIIGGASLYTMFLPEADKIYLTEVDATKPADVFFPEFDRAEYERRVLKVVEFDDVKYQIVEYTRKAD